eukprot:TRINITY_DN31003_c0_g1_i1.p1 TRINITY_DN31003_c0_g1~~TRINITY_DN31003_c0_g1_i1.p1  ORF type:complete len:103 (-),score=3.50 TRINITY_DN31003_c0_g1_i1:160-438(-)
MAFPDWYTTVYPVDPLSNSPGLWQYPESFHDMQTCLSCLGLGNTYMTTTGTLMWCYPDTDTNFVGTSSNPPSLTNPALSMFSYCTVPRYRYR